MNGPTFPTEIFGTLGGKIDQQLVQRLFVTLNGAMNQKVETVHMLIHSTGGFVGDGIAAYNYLRSIPVNLVTYNAGLIASVAVLLYVAGKTRKATANANFILHKAGCSPPEGTNAQALKEFTKSLLADDARIESILKSELTLTKAQWRMHARTNLHLGPEEAKACGLTHSIEAWTPVKGAIPLFTL